MAKGATEQERFDGYVDGLAQVVGHADRVWPMRAYLTGLLLDGARKSVEPMAARIDPRQVSRTHQAMHHFVANAPWNDEAVLAVARDYALTQLERHAPVGAWVVDDTGIPKKGKHSVGVARQYCGVLGKGANCQVAVAVSLANRTMSVPAAWRLYVPKIWAQDQERRARVGMPEDVEFQEKWRIALEEIDKLVEDDLPPAPVVADAGYGDTTAFRDGLTKRGFSYVVGIKGDTTVWPPGQQPLGPAKWSGTGRPPTRLRRQEGHGPVAARELAEGMEKEDVWREVRWREGTKGTMRSRFAVLRVRPAHRDHLRRTPRPEEWLLIEWPSGEAEPTKYWLSTVPEGVDLAELVALAKIRWRIERDFQELKDELGLDHYEGRGWRGFHHHGVLCMAAYCFLAAERGRLSPPQPLAFLESAPLPEDFVPRGSPRQSRTA
jgi:SRSO17 transposase